MPAKFVAGNGLDIVRGASLCLTHSVTTLSFPVRRATRLTAPDATKRRAAMRAETKSLARVKLQRLEAPLCRNGMRCIMSREAAFNILALLVGAVIPIVLVIVVLNM
jgi:hypothetical protein